MSISPSRRDFLRDAALTSGALVAGGAVSSSATPPAKGRTAVRPNVLMICADQFRADFVGANRENGSARTPHIDALAERGTNFRQAMCNQPLCSPSRASLLTGVTATEAKVWKLGLEMNHDIPSIATTLKKDGYTTAFIGKWHISAVGRAAGGEEGGAHQEQTKDDSRGWVAPGPSRGGFDAFGRGERS